MNTIPPSTMLLSERINYYGADSVPVDTLIAALEKLEDIEYDAAEIEDLQREIQELESKVTTLEKEIAYCEDQLIDSSYQIERLKEELDAVTKEANT